MRRESRPGGDSQAAPESIAADETDASEETDHSGKSQFRRRHCAPTPPPQDIVSQLKRRREAALRLPPLEHSGQRDPWSRQ